MTRSGNPYGRSKPELSKRLECSVTTADAMRVEARARAEGMPIALWIRRLIRLELDRADRESRK